jgi:hypothetical protein
MQNHLATAQQRLAEAEVEGTAGGGLVKVTINGQGELIDLTIAPGVIEPGDPQETASTLADLVLAACRDAYRALGDVQEDMMAPLAGSLGDAAAEAGLPGLPGFPGFPGAPGAPGAVPGSVVDDDGPGQEQGQR